MTVQFLIGVDITSIAVSVIMLIGLLGEKNKSKSTFALSIAFGVVLLCLVSEVCSYTMLGPGYPKIWIIFLATTVCSFGTLGMIALVWYWYFFIAERTVLNKWFLITPTLLLICSFVYVVVCCLSGTVFTIDNGIPKISGGMPKITMFLLMAVMVYLPVVAFINRRQIGTKSALILGQFGVFPFITTLIPVLLGGIDYSFAAGCCSLVIVNVLLQNHRVMKTDEENMILSKKNEEIASMYAVSEAVARDVSDLFIIDRALGTSTTLKAYGHVIPVEKRISRPYEETWNWYMNKYVHQEDKEKLSKAVDLSNVVASLEQNTEYHYRFRVHQNGEYQHLQITFSYVGGHGSNLIVFGFRNINEIIREELQHFETIEKLNRQLEQANQAKTTFLFNMSHDIRTPMNAIVGYTKLIKGQLDNKEKCEDYLEKLEKSNEFLLSLINNVLEMARIDSGKVTLDEDVWATGGVSNEVMCVYAEAMRNKHIDFNMYTEVKTPYIWGDKLKVTEIMLNLVSNAHKYTPDGGKVTVSLTELPCDKQGWTIIQTTVEDTGIGMSEEYLPTIFEEFSREKNATEAKIQGTGLGMPIVKKLVELMGGTITVESKLGKGSKFMVNIPHRIADKPGTVIEVSSSSSDFSVLLGKRVILAEDNELNAEIATEILSEFGVKVDHAADGVECINMLQHAPCKYYDLILMDVQMPNMNGYEATRTIRQLEDPARNQIPILAMTANAFEEDKKEALAAGMNGHLAKPINVEEMMKALAEILG